jgi:hypothetical protein
MKLLAITIAVLCLSVAMADKSEFKAKLATLV